MQLLLEFTGQGIYGIDLQGNCTFINRATCEMVGYRPEEALGRNMHDLVHHHKRDGSVYPSGAMPRLPRIQEGGELPRRRRSDVAPARHPDPG